MWNNGIKKTGGGGGLICLELSPTVLQQLLEVVGVAGELQDEGSAAHLLRQVLVHEVAVLVQLVQIRHLPDLRALQRRRLQLVIPISYFLST